MGRERQLDWVDIACDLIEDKLSLLQIARKNNCSRVSISQIKKKMGLPLRQRKFERKLTGHPLLMELHEKIRNNGAASLHAIADKAGYDHETVRRLFYTSRSRPNLMVFLDILKAAGGEIRIDWNDNRKQGNKGNSGPSQKV